MITKLKTFRKLRQLECLSLFLIINSSKFEIMKTTLWDAIMKKHEECLDVTFGRRNRWYRNFDLDSAKTENAMDETVIEHFRQLTQSLTNLQQPALLIVTLPTTFLKTKILYASNEFANRTGLTGPAISYSLNALATDEQKYRSRHLVLRAL